MWSDGGNIFRQTQDTQWLIEGTLFSHLKRRVNNIKIGKKVPAQSGDDNDLVLHYGGQPA